ncbi:alpha/beta hydrolase [Flavobacterium sp. JP2137]|uniref:alpha/beta hydrolase n=1 Tax=Flavobacterium sp. JP2137 TaxID=3414510 RepID=UPI003D2FA268
MKLNLAVVLWLFSSALIAQTTEKRVVDIDAEIQGNLYLGNPKSKLLLLVIPGSGPTDRNGNTLSVSVNNSLKFLAEGLAQEQYNVFTYDKRVLAQLRNKTIPEVTVFEDPLRDVALIMTKLREQFADIVLVGHSEGSLIALLAAQQSPTKALVSLAGAGQTIDVIIEEQIARQAPFLKKQTATIVSQLKKGERVNEVIPMLQSLFNPGVQPYLISWMTYDPAAEIAKLQIPLLLINGTQDIQVGVAEAKRLHQANSASDLVLIEGMNHIFKNIVKDEDNIKSYNQANLPLHSELIPVITAFLEKNKLR